MAEKKPGGNTGKASGTGNLKPPWAKGVSGNPNGRPKGASLIREMRDALDKTELMGKKLPGGKTARVCLAEAVMWHAIRGNAAYLKHVLERFYGAVPLRVEQKTTNDGNSSITAEAAAAGIRAALEAIGQAEGRSSE